MKQIWLVESQSEESWGNNNEGWDTVSAHKSEEKAREVELRVKKSNALYLLSRGDFDAVESPDKVMGEFSKRKYLDKVTETIRQRIAIPGADFWEVIMSLGEEYSRSWEMGGYLKETRVRDIPLED